MAVFNPLLMQSQMSGSASDFFAQLQAQSQILSLFVLFAILMLMTVLGFILLRLIRARRAAEQANASTAVTGTGVSAMNAAMPDLEMLLSTPEPMPPASTFESSANILRQPGIVNVRMADGRVVEAAEMLIIARDRRNDNLLVQIGDYAYDGTEGGVDPEFRRRFVKVMRELSDIAPALSKASSNAEPPLTYNPPQPMPTPPAAADPNAAAAELDLAGQIEVFLQQKLTHSPEFSSRGLHVHSAPGGGVQIEVDGQTFLSVEEVSDPDVRAYLQQTIAEWQATRP